ncbi:hypothetical protein Scep_015009 [Stephania cephalantha]|uniref:Uncharacterized protein n=1 Tax=Stephania cephalantha TaxID=152367 RepID=A0AAP0J2G0_9MAGN
MLTLRAAMLLVAADWEPSPPPDYTLSIVLSRLSHDLSTKTLAHRYSLDPNLVCKITNMVTRVLATKLYPEFLEITVSHRLLQIIHAFRDLTALPNVCGAIDASPVKLNLNLNRNNVEFLVLIAPILISLLCTDRLPSSVGFDSLIVASIAHISAYDEITVVCTHLAIVRTHLDEITAVRRVHPDVAAV